MITVKNEAIMATICDFCKSLSPTVYCKADAAHLCLSCDVKVHSANSLSYRHSRTLVCESCKCQPAFVRCFVCCVFVCKNCDDISHGDVYLQHKRKLISSYVGSPCAKELAALWGFELNEFDKVFKDDNTSSILKQILELETIQLSEIIDNSHSIHSQNQIEQSIDRSPDFQNIENPKNAMIEVPYFSSPFPLHGDSFWQCKSPSHNNEIWLHNMQDLGVCDEIGNLDDVQIPDVDLIFRNFDEVFGNEHEPSRALVDGKDVDIAGLYADKYSSFGKLDRVCSITIEDKGNSDQIHQFETINSYHHQIKPTCSATSFSVSRITSESSGSEYKDDGIFPSFFYSENNTTLDGQENVVNTYKEKKSSDKWGRPEKQSKYTSHKSKLIQGRGKKVNY